MPSYDFRCDNCQRRVMLTYKTYADYDQAVPTCTYCGSTHMTRWITRVGVAKSFGSRFGSAESDDSALADLADADPATLGRYMRQMSDETGEDLGDEFNHVVDRLEKGEDPASIEASMAAPDDIPLGGDAE